MPTTILNTSVEPHRKARKRQTPRPPFHLPIQSAPKSTLGLLEDTQQTRQTGSTNPKHKRFR